MLNNTLNKKGVLANSRPTSILHTIKILINECFTLLPSSLSWDGFLGSINVLFLDLGGGSMSVPLMKIL